MRQPLDGCEPSAAMCATASTPDHPPDPGGVPEIVRRSLRPSLDSPTIVKHARIWGGGDEITYWIVPHLRCEVADLEADMVCVTPVKESYAEAASACVESKKTSWIHFPDGDVPAIAGFAPARARQAVVHVEGGAVLLPSFQRRDDEVPGSMRSKVVRCAPSRTPASSVTTAKASEGDGSCATNVATRRSAACSRTSSSSPPLVVGATRNGRPARRACQVGGGRRVAAVRSR